MTVRPAGFELLLLLLVVVVVVVLTLEMPVLLLDVTSVPLLLLLPLLLELLLSPLLLLLLLLLPPAALLSSLLASNSPAVGRTPAEQCGACRKVSHSRLSICAKLQMDGTCIQGASRCAIACKLVLHTTSRLLSFEEPPRQLPAQAGGCHQGLHGLSQYA